MDIYTIYDEDGEEPTQFHFNNEDAADECLQYIQQSDMVNFEWVVGKNVITIHSLAKNAINKIKEMVG